MAPNLPYIALSVSIKELEEELGQVILIRTKKGVAFTNYGLQLLEHTQRIFEEVELIRKTIHLYHTNQPLASYSG